jgi:hypothetical protein
MNADIKRKRIIYNNERRSSSTKRNFLLLLLTPRRRLLQAPPFASAHTDGIDQRGINQWPKRTFSFFFIFILSGDSIHHCLISKTFFLLLLLLYVPGLWQLKLYIDAKRCFWCVLYVYRFPIFLLYVCTTKELTSSYTCTVPEAPWSCFTHWINQNDNN